MSKTDLETPLVNSNGVTLFTKYWWPTSDSTPRALVCISHGYAEHCLRYDKMAQHFTKQNMLVFGHDQMGHGQTPGKRGQVYSYKAYVDDIILHVEKVSSIFPSIPVFIVGHSMGGGIATLAALKKPALFRGVVLIAPLIKLHPATVPKILGTITYYIGSYITFVPGDALDTSAVCSDQAVVDDYLADKLVYHGRITSGSGAQFMYMTEEIQKCLPEIRYRFLTLHGDLDTLTDPLGSKLLHEKAASEDKTYSEYKGCKHQLHNEPNGHGERCVKEMTEWILERCDSNDSSNTKN